MHRVNRRVAVIAAAVGMAASGMALQYSVMAAARRQPPSVNPATVRAMGSLAVVDNAFGSDLFLRLRHEGPGKNLFISPVSVALALQMTDNGAEGATRNAMDRTLHLTGAGTPAGAGLSLGTLNAANRMLMADLESADPGVKLAIANSLWVGRGDPIRPDYLARVRENYGATVSPVDFASPATVRKINRWVSENTAGKIPSIVDQTSPSEVLLLVNATYFKGRWSVPFERAATRSQPFHLANGAAESVPMMHRSGHFHYAENSLCQAVTIPYGKGRLEMLVALPRPGVSLDQVYAKLPGIVSLGEIGFKEGDVALPRFKMEYGASLNDALKALGMGAAFDGRHANFRGISPALGFYISDVKHKSYVDVNEEGTEAAAATSIALRATAVAPRYRFNMVVDRPFYFALRDHQTGAVLFMGQVTKP